MARSPAPHYLHPTQDQAHSRLISAITAPQTPRLRPPAAGDYAAQPLTGTRRAALLGTCARARATRRHAPSAVVFIKLPHPRPLPEGEGILHDLLSNVKICAEHYCIGGLIGVRCSYILSSIKSLDKYLISFKSFITSTKSSPRSCFLMFWP